MNEYYKNLSLEDIKDEVWKDIKGYEGSYQVSNMGRVKSFCRKTRILKPQKTQDGYLQVCLCRDGKKKRLYVHRLVAGSFIPNLENKETINHINEIKTDNHVSNLEWMTRAENNNHGTHTERGVKKRKGRKQSKEWIDKRAKGNSKPVLQFTLDGKLVKEWSSITEAGKSGFTPSNIIKCCRGKQKTSKGYIWKYKQ